MLPPPAQAGAGWVSTVLDKLIKDTKHGLHVRRFCDSEAKKIFRLPTAVRRAPKTPRIWAFLAEPFRTAFCFFSKSLCGAKNKEYDSPIRKRLPFTSSDRNLASGQQQAHTHERVPAVAPPPHTKKKKNA
jgi:hypothetical protein